MEEPKKRTRFQIDASPELRDFTHEVARRHRKSLTEYVLRAVAAFAQKEDKDLAEFIEKELSEKAKPGRPQNTPS
jgi:uncharacterized protein (DUF1778 family)